MVKKDKFCVHTLKFYSATAKKICSVNLDHETTFLTLLESTKMLTTSSPYVV